MALLSFGSGSDLSVELDNLFHEERLEAGRNPSSPKSPLPLPICRQLNGAKNGIRSKIQTLNKWLEKIEVALDANQSISNEAKLKANSLYQDFLTYDSTQPGHMSSIFRALHPAEMIVRAISSYHEYRDTAGYHEACDRFINVMERCANEETDAVTITSASPVPVSLRDHNNAEAVPRSNVALHKVSIPIFKGDPLEYLPFVRAFDTHIDCDPRYTDYHKFDLLKTHVAGEAWDVIKNLELEPHNYAKARASLQRTYDDPVARGTAKCKRILAAQPRSQSPKDILSFVRLLAADFNSMHSAGEGEKDYPTRILIMQKVPSIFWRQVDKYESEQRKLLNIPELLDAIILEVISLDRQDSSVSAGLSVDCPSIQTHAYAAPVSRSKRPIFHNTQPVAYSLKPNQCFFCRGMHAHEDCLDFPTPVSKRVVLRVQKHAPCWICFSSEHRSRSCSAPRCTHCSQDHASFLCDALHKKSNNIQSPNNTVHPVHDISSNDTQALVAIDRSLTPPGILATAEVLVTSSSKKRRAIAVFDGGNMKSLIDNRIVEELRLPKASRDTFRVHGVGNKLSTESGDVYLVPLLLPNGDTVMISAIGVNDLVGSYYIPHLSSSDSEVIRSLYPQSPFPPTGQVTPELLFGVDVLWELFAVDSKVKLSSGMFLFDSSFGPVVSGPSSYSSSPLRCLASASAIQPELSLDIEGISSTESLDSIAEELFSKSIQRTNQGRLSVSLPFRISPSEAHLSNNYSVAYQRLRSLFSKYHHSPRWREYVQTVDQQLASGVLEPVKDKDDGSHCYYIPHSGVFKDSSLTTKLRIVLDASSHIKTSPSLNDIRLAGPSILPDIRKLYLRFRLAPIVVVADIEKAFHQVELNVDHRKFTRMLWLKDVSKPPSQTNVRHLQHTRLPFGVTSSPFLLAASLRYHLLSKNSLLANEIINSIYVDNLVLTRKEPFEEDILEAVSYINEIGMNLREFSSNMPSLLSQLESERRCTSEIISALGLLWSPRNDTFFLQVPKWKALSCVTRREALSILASFYDPLGLFSPVSLLLRLEMNKIWSDPKDYDTPVDTARCKSWTELVTRTAEVISSLPIPRMVLPPELLKGSKNSSLLVFADASASAVGVCIYLTSGDRSHLLLAKSLVSPKGTIPRLELTAVVLAFEILDHYQECLLELVQSVTIFSDSTTVLHWVFATSSPQPIFVVNRLKKIHSIYSKLRFLFDLRFEHIPGADNPADIASRGTDIDSLMRSRSWWQGYLKPPPRSEFYEMTPFSSFRTICAASNIHAKTSHPKTKEVPSFPVFHPELFSSYRRYLIHCKAVVTLLQCVRSRLRNKERLRQSFDRAFPITADTSLLSNKAEYLAVLIHQKGSLTAISQISARLDCSIDPVGAIVLRGRFPLNSGHPFIILGRSSLAILLINHYHSLNSHAGPSITLCRLRKSGFWLLPGKGSVARVLRKCVLCKRFNARPFPRPPLKVLPLSRTEGNVFQRVGLDEAGPFKLLFSSRDYFLLVITCFITRAVHIEIVDNLSAQELVLALRRFFATYRVPEGIFLDNLSSHKLLPNCVSPLNLPPPLAHLSEVRRIRWQFITPLSPWQGGLYERIVGLIKLSLNKALWKYPPLSFSHFLTLVRETMSVINSRPLYPHIREDGIVVTPQQFLFPYPSHSTTTCLPEEVFAPQDSPMSKKLRMISEATEGYISFLWEEWRKGYLSALRERNFPQVSPYLKSPRLNEVVLCSDAKKNRKGWHLGVIVELYPDVNGDIRTIGVRHPDGKVYLRAPESIYPLEITDSSHLIDC